MAGKAQEMRIDMESLIDSHQSRHSQLLLCVIAILTLLTGGFGIVIIHHYLFSQPTNLPAQPGDHTAKVTITRELKHATKNQDLWTVEKGAKYLIFGCVKFSEASEDAVLKLTTEGDDRSIEPIIKDKSGVCCFRKEHQLVSNITIRFGAACEESILHFQEL